MDYLDMIMAMTTDKWKNFLSDIVGNTGRDILADWKRERFIIADNHIHGHGAIIIVLCDITFWNNNFEDLAEWCEIYGGKMAGMTVELDTQEQLTAFVLRWR